MCLIKILNCYLQEPQLEARSKLDGTPALGDTPLDATTALGDKPGGTATLGRRPGSKRSAEISSQKWKRSRCSKHSLN